MGGWKDFGRLIIFTLRHRKAHVSCSFGLWGMKMEGERIFCEKYDGKREKGVLVKISRGRMTDFTSLKK
jgi:hypothetical protein